MSQERCAGRPLSRRASVSVGVALGALLPGVLAVVVLRSRTEFAQVVGDFSILLAAITAVAGSMWAAHRGGSTRRGWQFMAVATAVWVTSQLVWTAYGLGRHHVYPFPSIADLGFVGYALPAAAALLMFPRTSERGVTRLRVVLDALVIAASILLFSWVTVLGSLARTAGPSLAGLVSLAYPIADVLVGSLVLALGMRVPAGARRPWLFLGAGLLVLTVTDSTFVSLTAHGDTGLTGSPLAIGWVCAFLLIAAAGVFPTARSTTAAHRHFSVGQELLPYLPFVAALVATAGRRFGTDEPFVLVNGAVLLVAFVGQQLLIAVEKVQLANGLEETVARRTAELTAADGRFRSLVEYSEDAIIANTTAGVVVTWNPAAERLYGYSAAEIVGRSASVIIPEPLREQERQTVAALGRGALVPNYETERVRKDGSVVAVALTVSPIYVDDVVQGTSVIGHDISERKRQEAELAEAQNAALEASRAKSEFLAMMSHEIRTPMNGVIGLTELLLDTPLDTAQRRYANGVRGAGEALLSIIDDILDFSKLEAGKVELEDTDYDPRQLVEDIGVLLAGTASAKSLELIAYCEPDVPAALRGDAGRLRQVLMNLVSNALKFTAQGEVVLRARLARNSGGHVDVEFVVSDTGIGIAPMDRNRMFEPFSQADASTTRRFGGTGLGLAICWRLVEAMGGRLGLDSELGVGSTFRFAVPMTVQPDSAPAPLTRLLEGIPVLVVDDNEANRLILAKQLSAWAMRPVLVSDGTAALLALQAAARNGTPYPIAILDLCMPGMDGLELATAIATDDALAATRTLMLSSAVPIDRAQATPGGSLTFINKPVRQSELYDGLVRLAGPSRATAAEVEQNPGAPMTVPAGRGRVLVVEDNHVNQLVAEGVLHKLGYVVEVAADGRAALVAMAAGDFDAVLMDCHMPMLDGYEATLEWRRREGDRPRLPIIAMTASVLTADRERCVAAGMDDFIGKPIDVLLVERTLATWTRTWREARRGTTVSSSGTPAIDSPPEGPAVDERRLDVLRRIGPADGWGLLPAVVEAFLAEAPEQHAAICAAARAGDAQALGRAAHKLKGAASNLGATAVAAVCGDLEAAARFSARRADAVALARLERELDRAGTALAGAVAGRK